MYVSLTFCGALFRLLIHTSLAIRFYTWVKHVEGQRSASKDTPLPKYAPVPSGANASSEENKGGNAAATSRDEDDLTLEELEKEILGVEGSKRRDVESV